MKSKARLAGLRALTLLAWVALGIAAAAGRVTASEASAAKASATETPLTVFAAASLTDVLQQVGAQYTKASGVPVRFSFAASSALAKQIESGARIDMFFSADQEWMDYLQERKLIAGATRRNLLANRLVLVAPADSKVALKIAPGFPLLAALGASGRLATGDPDAVPVGKYARAALTALGVWDQVEPRLVRAENVRAALVFVARGETPLGIVYATDAKVEPKVRVVDAFPESSHPPVTYPVALTANASPRAQGLLEFLNTPAARATFQQAGFTPLRVAQERSPHGVGCTGFRYDLERELKLFAGAPERIVAGSADAATPVATDRLYEVRLQPQARFKFALTPDKATVADGSYAGVLSVQSNQSAVLRVTINEQAWLDVMAGGVLMTSRDHTGSPNCKLLHKSVEFPVTAGKPLLVQISGSTVPTVRLTLTQPPT